MHTAKQVSLLKSKRHEEPFAEQSVTYELRKTLPGNGRTTCLHPEIGSAGKRISSVRTGMVCCIDAWKKFHAKAVAIPCAGRLCLQGHPSSTTQHRFSATATEHGCHVLPKRKQQTTKAAHHTREREREGHKETPINERT